MARGRRIDDRNGAISKRRRSPGAVAEDLDRVGDHLGVGVRNAPLWS